MLYDDAVIYAKSTPYQRLVLTRWRDDLRLFIDGNIQFSSVDEFRYHEALVHPAMGLVACAPRVLLLGGGDGLAAREVLKHAVGAAIDLVDLDPEMTRLFSLHPHLLTELNRRRAQRPAGRGLQRGRARSTSSAPTGRYDVVIIDLPDPNNESLGKLYTRSFYRLVAKHLTPRGVMVTQATSPFYATATPSGASPTPSPPPTSPRRRPRCSTLPYRASVPSFGEWGFVLASLRPLYPEQIRLTVPTRYLTPSCCRRCSSSPRTSRPAPPRSTGWTIRSWCSSTSAATSSTITEEIARLDSHAKGRACCPL